MQSWINQHSFLVGAAAAMVLLAAVLFRDGIRSGDVLALAALGVGLAVAFLVLRPNPGSAVDDARSEIGRGTPVLLEFQSPY